MVQGLFKNAAVNTTSFLRRNIHANKRQLTVCNPMVGENAMKTPTAKEVASYRSALWHGYERVKESGMLTTNMIIDIQSYIENNRAGIMIP